MGDTFPESELRRAIAEVESWGLTSASIAPTRPSTAELVLLDRTQIHVECSEQGWTLLDHPEATPLFPTLDDLLESVSPEFARARFAKLFAAIEHVANERSSSSSSQNGDD
ncbi:hypothetical protein JCM11491_002832 [Sporobolomyces phaffii]